MIFIKTENSLVITKMKIFALATAVSAKSFKRTEFPGEGIINAQGAFFADQTSNGDQVQQVSFQKKQCCEHLRWSYHNYNNIQPNVWVSQQYDEDNNIIYHKQMPVYKGKKDGETVFIWFNFMGPPDKWFGHINTAHWVISKEVGVYGDSTPNNQLVSDFGGLTMEQKGYATRPMCLHEATQWQNRFDCGTPPREQNGETSYDTAAYKTDDLSCDAVRENDEYEVFWEGNQSTCNLGKLLEGSGRKQITRALNQIDPSKEGELNKAYKTIVDKWNVLTGQEYGLYQYPYFDCGFNEKEDTFTKSLSPIRGSLDPENCDPKSHNCKAGSGFIDKCDINWICHSFNDIDSFGKESTRDNAVYLVKEHLDSILFLTEEYFTRYHSKGEHRNGPEDGEPWKINGCQQVQTDKGSFLLNNDRKTCQPTDYCGQRIREIYKAVNEFDKFFRSIGEGPIEKLSKYDGGWINDKKFF